MSKGADRQTDRGTDIQMTLTMATVLELNLMDVHKNTITWWRHQMETYSALLALCAGNSPVPGEFPAQRPVTRSFDVYFDLRPNKRLSKQSWGWWLETLSCSLLRHCNVPANICDISPWVAIQIFCDGLQIDIIFQLHFTQVNLKKLLSTFSWNENTRISELHFCPYFKTLKHITVLQMPLLKYRINTIVSFWHHNLPNCHITWDIFTFRDFSSLLQIWISGKEM